MNPSVSVIIPCYNMENYLSNCIKSLDAQIYKNFEAIFINDGSKDKTQEILESSSKTHKNFVVINQENRGLSAARNAGLKVAKGEYVIFLDPDDMYFPNYISRMVELVTANNAQYAICNFIRIRDGHDFDKLKFPYRKKKVEVLNQSETVKELLSQNKFDWNVWTKIYVNKILKDNHLKFQEKTIYGEDLLFNYLYLKHVDKAAFVDENLHYYVQRKNSAIHQKFKESRLTTFYGINYIIKDLKENFPKLTSYGYTLRMFICCEMAYFMHKSRYDNEKVIKKISEYMKDDVKYVKKCKAVAHYRRSLLPLVPGLVKMMFKSTIKKQKQERELLPCFVEELQIEQENP